MGFFKINTDGTIEIANKQHSQDWKQLSQLQQKEDGTYYTYYLPDMVDGKHVPDIDKENEALALDTKQETDKAKAEALSRLTVTTTSGKVFYADTEARIDLQSAIDASLLMNTTQTMWKLAKEFEGARIVNVTIDEIREASALALQAKGSIVGATLTVQ